MHKVFISYHHTNDQGYKEHLVEMAKQHALFISRSVQSGDISVDLNAQRIRKTIRDEYLQDSTVTIVLVGTETHKRKHVDWEIYSSIYDGKINKKSGVLVVTLPTITTCRIYAKHGHEEKALYDYPANSWQQIGSWDQCKQACPSMPDRIVDNLVAPKALVSVTSWVQIKHNPELLRALIDFAFRDRAKCEYDLRRPMM